MPRFAANISLLFAELPFLDRFQAASEAGFAAVEILFPYDLPASQLLPNIRAFGLHLVLINAPPPHGDRQKPGFAAVPGGQENFRRDLMQVLDVATVLQPTHIHLMAGYETGQAARQTMVENLRWAADYAPDQRFTIEPLNPVAQPGYFLNDYHQAADILSETARFNVGLQFDSYHAHMIHGDALQVWNRFRPLITHAQIGAAPDRKEPGNGPTDFPALFAAMDESGYDGWVSAEYTPSTERTAESLEWMNWAS